MRLNERINVFYGLNNRLNPASAEYQEGMAYVSDNARIDEQGTWGNQQALKAVAGTIATESSPTGGGSHYKNLAPDNVNTIVNMAVGTSCDVGANDTMYSTDGSGVVDKDGGTVSSTSSCLDPPADSDFELTASDTTNKDLPAGTYFYIITNYKEGVGESLPTKAKRVDVSADTKDYILVDNGGGNIPVDYDEVRIYRTNRVSPDDGLNPDISKFYFVHSLSSAGAFNDYPQYGLSKIEYEGRGSSIPQDIDYLVAFDNRMLYFKKNDLYWSSSDRPEEVAQEYELTIENNTDTTVDVKPKLSTGVYGEAKKTISELSGQTVKGAIPFNGRLYIFTNSTTGYLRPSNSLEGYSYVSLYEGVGITSDKTLALSPFGLFGADQNGMWVLQGSRLRRLSDDRVDIDDSSKSTYISNTDRQDSFGCWIPVLNEYWWGVSGTVIAYQADKDTFAGPYNYAVSGGCSFANDAGAQAYLGGSTPDPTSKSNVSIDLQFWLGQSAPTAVKDTVELETMFAETADCTLEAIQNNIASDSTTGQKTKAVTDSYATIAPDSSGRMFRLKITGTCKLTTLNYRFNSIDWDRRHR